MLFDVSNKSDLAALLGVGPREIDYVISRLGQFYRPKKLTKPDGTFRQLYVPSGKLKDIQARIKQRILDKVAWLPCVHGGVRGRSVLSNASPHVSQPIVFTLDIKGFFPSIGPSRVESLFKSLGFKGEAAKLLTVLTTWKYELPQGSHTSTDLANLALTTADWRIERIARQRGFRYTRYIDDLSLSGGFRLLKYRKLIERIVESEGFELKAEKTATMHAGMRQVVTKLVVNGKLNVPRDKREEIRKEVFAGLSQSGSAISPSAKGRLAWLANVNPDAGEKLRFRISRKAPHHD